MWNPHQWQVPHCATGRSEPGRGRQQGPGSSDPMAMAPLGSRESHRGPLVCERAGTGVGGDGTRVLGVAGWFPPLFFL